MSGIGRYRAILSNQAVALLVTAQTFARVGEQFILIGLLWTALDLTHSAVAMGVVLGVYTGGVLVAGFFAASLLDRFPRKPLMLADNAVRVLCVGAIAYLGVSHALNIWLLAALACVTAMASAITIVGTRVYLPTMVPDELIVTAFAVDSSLYQIAAIAGPALAGIVTARFGASWTMAAAAAFFFIFVVIAAFIPAGALDAGLPPKARDLSIAEELAGARYIIGEPVLRGLTLLTMIANFFFNACIIGLALLSKDSFGLGAVGQGFMLAALAVGSLVASIALGAGHWPYPRGASLIGSSVVLGVLLALLGLAPSPWVAYVVLFTVGVVDGGFFIWMSELRQRTPPPELLARTISASMILNTLMWPLSNAVTGLVLGALGPRPTFWLAGALMTVYSGLFVRNQALRRAP